MVAPRALLGSAVAFALCFVAWLTFAVTGIPIGANPPLGAAIDALKAGVIGAMILAKMTRATRGHTGRDLSADRLASSICVKVTLAASRVVAAFVEARAVPLLIASACFWIAAFARFALGYGPMMAIPRGVR